ncbi:hypothetical protein A4A49_32779 [Nicotiana attenuata]|uniref:Uncharacterized protein n=1 Tax=Nicotiana attenuata TaxID=49451 RepID=A0A1J6KJ31_NICAT|nr:hypothetical protein A4A49_32779 [Nicotiana attenuata]
MVAPKHRRKIRNTIGNLAGTSPKTSNETFEARTLDSNRKPHSIHGILVRICRVYELFSGRFRRLKIGASGRFQGCFMGG